MFFDIVVGVLVNHNKQVLVGQRQSHQIYPDYWEFPGGKVEAGESLITALKREMYEELGICVESATNFICAPYQYPDRYVHLHAFYIQEFTGNLKGNEGQLIEWIALYELSERKNLEANQPIVQAIRDCQIV